MVAFGRAPSRLHSQWLFRGGEGGGSSRGDNDGMRAWRVQLPVEMPRAPTFCSTIVGLAIGRTTGFSYVVQAKVASVSWAGFGQTLEWMCGWRVNN